MVLGGGSGGAPTGALRIAVARFASAVLADGSGHALPDWRRTRRGRGPGRGPQPLRLMVMGVPSVGDEPAVTKSQQSLQIGPDTWLTDTPGLMWPKIAHDSDGYMLAASHAIGVNAVIEEEVATFLGGLLLARYPQAVAARYKLKDAELAALDGVGLIETVARKRGVFRKLRGGGNEPDREKASLVLLGDYRSGALGRISLETPETRAAMLAKAVLATSVPAAPDPEGDVADEVE